MDVYRERVEARRTVPVSSNLIRSAGLAAIVGGVLWALWTLGFNFVDYHGELGTPAYERY